MSKRKKAKVKRQEHHVSWISQILLRANGLRRDIGIVAIVSTLSVLFLLFLIHREKFFQEEKVDEAPQSISEVKEEDVKERAEIFMDTTLWELYQTSWYGFAVKYPQGWKKPLLKSASKGVSWEYRYQFRRDGDVGEYDDFGFDVVVYNRAKVGNLSQTDEFPVSKNDADLNQMICEEPQIHMVEGETYPVDKVSIRLDDERYHPTYFYTLIRDDYLYTIVPIVSGKEYGTLSEEEAKSVISEFATIASTFYPIDIVRPKPVAIKPRITAPLPAAETKRDAQGRRICAKDDDKPSKSKKGKKKHLDMECCLDPDEYPNPHCHYSHEVYGKLLGK